MYIADEEKLQEIQNKHIYIVQKFGSIASYVHTLRVPWDLFIFGVRCYETSLSIILVHTLRLQSLLTWIYKAFNYTEWLLFLLLSSKWLLLAMHLLLHNECYGFTTNSISHYWDNKETLSSSLPYMYQALSLSLYMPLLIILPTQNNKSVKAPFTLMYRKRQI